MDIMLPSEPNAIPLIKNSPKMLVITYSGLISCSIIKPEDDFKNARLYIYSIEANQK